ncbi:pyridine nucleotide-disulfide oxidoreductase [Nostoc sp. 3335mG]|nr:pyridine nucleotide-disulfide oxidoreductase [Nostoc sp. 3335mG]
MRHIAVIGSGPAGFYTAEAALKTFGSEVRVDLIDRLPVPYGLIRSGVAPDHQSIKAVTRRYENTASDEQVRFFGNVTVGQDVTVEELRALYDAVVTCTGAPADKRLGVPGDDLPGVIGSAAFVGWYNGHPDFAGLHPPLDGETVAVIGNGNVALDVARILAKTPEEFAGSDIVGHALEALRLSKVRRIIVCGRRGPHQIAMTPKELGELGHLTRAAPLVDPAAFPPIDEDEALDPGHRKSIGLLRGYAAAGASDKPVTIDFRFFSSPVAILGTDGVEGIRLEHTHLAADGHAEGDGQIDEIACSMVISCIGYRSITIEGLPYDDRSGHFANEEGRIGGIGSGLYCAGWARRGPTGTIGTNRPDGFQIVEEMAKDLPNPQGKEGGDGLARLLASRTVNAVSFDDWRRIEEAENLHARDGSPREKFVDLAEMIAAARPA